MKQKLFGSRMKGDMVPLETMVALQIVKDHHPSGYEEAAGRETPDQYAARIATETASWLMHLTTAVDMLGTIWPEGSPSPEIYVDALRRVEAAATPAVELGGPQHG